MGIEWYCGRVALSLDPATFQSNDTTYAKIFGK